jgi:putative sigma-54 modulation protein
MQMTVQVNDKYASPWVQSNLADILMGALAKFRDRVRDVSLVIDDVNGPKGGVDKQCKCIVKLKRMSPIVIKDRDSSVGSLVRRVAERTAYTLGEKLNEHRTKSRRKASAGKQATRRRHITD